MSAIYTRLGKLVGKFGVPARYYLTAHTFGRNFTYKSSSTWYPFPNGTISEKYLKGNRYISRSQKVSVKYFFKKCFDIKSFAYLLGNMYAPDEHRSRPSSDVIGYGDRSNSFS